jgi:uncharacterized protein
MLMTVATAETQVTAFEGARRIAAGPLAYVTRAVRTVAQAGFPVLVFDDATGRQVEVDLRGTEEQVLAGLAPPPQRGPGRPKLGVSAREVTLLPRHWEWLATQQGGASVALRKLVEEAMRSPAASIRQAQDVAYRFMASLAGDLPGYEEANRALFAGDDGAFARHTQAWPADVRDYARALAARAFPIV